MKEDRIALILKPGALYCQKTFGSNVVNQGAALFQCEWNGGRFECGLFMGGLFRSGQFVGGTFLGGVFWGGAWLGGMWEGGFDRYGIYHPRGDSPPPL